MRGLEALNTFSAPCIHRHPAPCYPGCLPCVLGGMGEGGVDWMLKSEAMVTTLEGFCLAAFSSCLSSQPHLSLS